MTVPVSPTELKPLEFDSTHDSHDYKSPTSKIGWLRAQADKPGARFDIVIKDSLDRVVYRKEGCGNATNQYGELLNLPTMAGQDLKVEVANLKGASTLKVFLN